MRPVRAMRRQRGVQTGPTHRRNNYIADDGPPIHFFRDID
jgi:hypothetical protein